MDLGKRNVISVNPVKSEWVCRAGYSSHIEFYAQPMVGQAIYLSNELVQRML